jgi:hypothetical protein
MRLRSYPSTCVHSTRVPGALLVQFKQTDGSTLRGEFAPDTTLQEVRHFIDTHRTGERGGEGSRWRTSLWPLHWMHLLPCLGKCLLLMRNSVASFLQPNETVLTGIAWVRQNQPGTRLGSDLLFLSSPAVPLQSFFCIVPCIDCFVV